MDFYKLLKDLSYKKFPIKYWHGVTLIIVSFVLMRFREFLYKKYIVLESHDWFPPPSEFWFSLVVLLTTVVVVNLVVKVIKPFTVVFEILYSYYYKILNRNIYTFGSESWPSEWVIQGSPVYYPNTNILKVVNSNSGFLIKNRSWKDCTINFELMFKCNSGAKQVGIIFRAQNLTDYFMLALRPDEVIPHTRLFGNFEVLQVINFSNIIKMKCNKYYKILVLIKNQHVQLSINAKKVADWRLPEYIEINYKQHKDKKDKNVDVVPEVYFRNKAGMIGFRAYPLEESYVKNLNVQQV